jgi:hypothetical protein
MSGLEISWFTEHDCPLGVILVVAIIPIGRYVIRIDFEDTPGAVLLGI